MIVRNMGCLNALIVSVLFLKFNSAEKSPCPKHFLYEPNKSQEDRWFGLILLKNEADINGVTLVLHFDKPVIQLGNWFGKVASNPAHTQFTIKNDKKTIRANSQEKLEIFAVYDPYRDIPTPQLTKIVLNGREICPKYEEEQINTAPAITVNINLPNCGIKAIYPTGLITNGENTVEGEWPWHAALYRLEGKKKIYICGGTLISQKHILTAAHCTTEEGSTVPRDANSVAIILGKHGTFVYGKYEQSKTISKIVVHQNFNRSNFHNDISIMVMSDPIQVTNYVTPICLWEEDTDAKSVISRIGTVVGWGRDHKNNAITDLLMEAKMPVVDRLECILSQGTYYSKFTNDNTLCAGFKNGTSVCNGDSGGGLVFPKKGTNGVDTVWQIRGIVSNTIAQSGNVCDPNYYVIFTDVAKYLNWIKEATS